MLAALAAAACDEQQTELKHCVDENGVVQDESNCTNQDGGTPVSGNPTHPGSTGGGHFFWYYGGSSTPVTRGTRITGGSYTPSPGRSYSPPSVHGGGSGPSIGRGGFGGTGAGHAGGGGGGGGGS